MQSQAQLIGYDNELDLLDIHEHELSKDESERESRETQVCNVFSKLRKTLHTASGQACVVYQREQTISLISDRRPGLVAGNNTG